MAKTAKSIEKEKKVTETEKSIEKEKQVAKTEKETAIKQSKKQGNPKPKESSKSKETSSKTAKKKESTTKKETEKAKQSTKKVTKKSGKLEEQPKRLKILGFNNLPLAVNVYAEVENAKAVVLVIHGMQEHSGRYEAFAKHLNKNGFIVVSSDLRGHGLTAESPQKRGFGENDIFTETIADQLNIIAWISENSNLPIYVFGHSYGSMLTQVLIQQTSLVEKAVICGTANGGSALMKAGGMVASLLSPFKNKESSGGLIEKLCIKSYGKKFEHGNWLTRDEKVFEAYIADPLCGGSFPFSFYKSMIKNMNKANDNISKIGNKKLFLIAGKCDPVGENGKQVEKLFKLYLKNNVDAKLKIYEDCRHELLNELNKEEVYADVIDFFNS